MSKKQNETSGSQPVIERKSPRGIRAPKWFGKILYFRDGEKMTVSIRVLSWMLGMSFPILLILLWLRDARQVRGDSGSASNGIGLPGQLIQGKMIEVPPLMAGPSSGAAFISISERARAERKDPRYSGAEVVRARAYEKAVPPGAVMKARLLTGASNGPVRAEAVEDLEINGDVLVPSGAILVGSGRSTDERLYVHFNQLVLQDGSVQTISADALAADDKIPGLKGSKVSRIATKLAASIGLNFVGGMAEALEDTQGQYGAVVRVPSVKNALLNGSERASMDEATDLMNGAKNTQPLIEVPQGTELYLLFSGGPS